MRAYSVFEKFEKDSDPIEDMGIGLPAFWRKEYEKMGSSTTEIEYRKYFPKDFVSSTASHEKIVNLLYGTLKYVTLNKLSPQKAFVKISVWCNIQYNYINEFEVRKMVADVLEKHFYMKVNPDFTLQEKFVKDSDPIKDMNIGITGLWDYTLEDAATEIWEIMKQYVWKQVLQARANGRTYVLFPALITKDGCEQLAFEPNEYTMKELVKEVQKHIDHAIKVGAINLTNVKYYPIKESVNEKFEEDGDPIKDMAIGLEHYRKKFKMYSIPSEFPSMASDLKELLITAFNAPIHEIYFLSYVPEEKNNQQAYSKNPQKTLSLNEKLRDLTKDAKELYAHSIKNQFGNKIEVYETEIGMIAAYHSDVNKGTYYFSDISAVIGLEEYV